MKSKLKSLRIILPNSRKKKKTPGDSPVTVEARPIDELLPHPRQKEYFADLADEDLQALANDIRANGMKELPEILPDGTILSGHQRRRAAIRLNWQTLKVRVRHDLAAADDASRDRYLIEANLHRRHLSKLQLARLYDSLCKLKGNSRQGQGDLRDQIGRRLGISGRSLSRLRQLLDLPPILQQAVDTKKLPHNLALKLMTFPSEQREPILKSLQEGQDVRRQIWSLLVHQASAEPQTAEPDDVMLRRRLRKWLELSSHLNRHQQALKEFVKPNQQQRLLAAQTLSAGLLSVFANVRPLKARQAE